MEADKEGRVVLIGGTGRSGTNITKAILGKHSKTHSLPFEHRFIVDPHGIIDAYKSLQNLWSPFFADKKINELKNYLYSLSKQSFLKRNLGSLIKKVDKKGTTFHTYEYQGWELDKWFPNYSKHVDVLITNLTTFKYRGVWPGAERFSYKNEVEFVRYHKKDELNIIFSGFLKRLISDLLKLNSKEVFIEDNTWNILFADALSELMPKGKLLHIIRNPKDVVASMRKQRWCPNGLEESIQFYKSIVNRWLDVKEKLPQDFYLDIYFEDLISKPEKKIEEICSFIGLNFEDELLQVDLSKSNIDRWKKEFSNSEIEFLDKELKHETAALGY